MQMRNGEKKSSVENPRKNGQKWQKMTKNGKFWLVWLHFEDAFLFFKPNLCWNLFKWAGIYGGRSIVTIKDSRDCSIEYKDRILGVVGGQKGKKRLKRIPTSKKIFPQKIAMLSDFLVLVEHNRRNRPKWSFHDFWWKSRGKKRKKKRIFFPILLRNLEN